MRQRPTPLRNVPLNFPLLIGLTSPLVGLERLTIDVTRSVEALIHFRAVSCSYLVDHRIALELWNGFSFRLVAPSKLVHEEITLLYIPQCVWSNKD